MRGLVVGRFQPLHNGHRALVQSALEDCGTLVVAIGSTNATPTLRNPFTFEERKRMVEAVFKGVRVAGVPDLNDPPRWVRHVLDLVGPVDTAYGNDPDTLDLFATEGIRTKMPGLVDRERFEARAVRMQIAAGDGAWRRCVPPEVARILDELNATRRLQTLEARA